MKCIDPHLQGRGQEPPGGSGLRGPQHPMLHWEGRLAGLYPPSPTSGFAAGTTQVLDGQSYLPLATLKGYAGISMFSMGESWGALCWAPKAPWKPSVSPALSSSLLVLPTCPPAPSHLPYERTSASRCAHSCCFQGQGYNRASHRHRPSSWLQLRPPKCG